MSETIDTMNRRLTNMNMSAEERARAMQAAYVGEAISDAFAALGRTVAGLYRRWREWSETRRSIAYLQGLDERLLADVGLNHATLEETLHRPALRPEYAHAAVAASVAMDDAAPAKVAANQDHAERRHAA